MPNYQHAKIYKLITDVNPELVYIGSTCQTLSKRKATHKSNHKRFLAGKGNYVTSYNILDVDPNPVIVLLETCPCNSKEELHARERYWIENTVCVNRYTPGRTKAEYYQANKEKTKERVRLWRKAHKEHTRAYYQANKKREKERVRLWRKANKERVMQRVTCGCGSTVYRRMKRRHERTKKHQAWAAEQ